MTKKNNQRTAGGKGKSRKGSKSFGQALFNSGRAAVNSPAGQAIISELRKEARQALSQVSGIPFTTSGMRAVASPIGGVGDSMSASIPAANGTVVRTGRPRMQSRKGGNMRVVHREYLADINLTSAGFDLQFQFGINPGNIALFPWLSQIAQRFELYSFKALRFIYEPQTATTTTGTIMLAIDYDASDPPPTSKTQMMSYDNAVRSPPWFACTHQSTSGDLHRLKTNYVLSGEPPTQSDIKTFDIGNLYVAVQTDSATLPISAGELYVEYDVELITPQISSDTLSATILGQQGSMTPDFPFGNVPVVIGPLPVQVVQDGTGGCLIYIQSAGFYEVVYSINFLDEIFEDANFEFQPEAGTLYNSYTLQGTALNFGGYGTVVQHFIEVVNPFVAAYDYQVTIGPTDFQPRFTQVCITPVAQSAIANATYSGSVSNDLLHRSRLGRIPASLKKSALPIPFALSGPPGFMERQRKLNRALDKRRIALTTATEKLSIPPLKGEETESPSLV